VIRSMMFVRDVTGTPTTKVSGLVDGSTARASTADVSPATPRIRPAFPTSKHQASAGRRTDVPDDFGVRSASERVCATGGTRHRVPPVEDENSQAPRKGLRMHLVRNPCLELDARYRALVDVASALTAHADLADVLLSLRRSLEPLIQFTFLVVSLWDGSATRSPSRSSNRTTTRPTGWSGARTRRGHVPRHGRAYRSARLCLARAARRARTRAGAGRVRRRELLRRAAHHGAGHARQPQLRLAGPARVLARRHRTSWVAWRTSWRSRSRTR
jgi:hypothetical protein